MLAVWLPLTKDLRNQGLDDMTITTANTNVFQNEGKLGSKSLDVSGHYAFRVPSLVKKRVFSCSFWYKPITDSSLSDNWRRIVVFDTYTSDGSTTGAIFRFESSYGYQSSNTTYCISIHNNVGEPIASIGTGLGASDGWNKWQHIAITADGTTLRCYRNGTQVATGSMRNGGMLQGTVHIGYSGNRPVGRLNDFRLYDHCLSPMEVKELAKGLVLHYPLNRQGWGQENLDNFSSVVSNWAMESLSGSNYSDSSYGNVIKLVTNAANQRMYHHVISTLWQSGQVYTVSFLAKADQNGRTCNMSRSIADFSPTFTLTTQWKRYSGKITSTATPGGGTLSFRINQSGATVYITQIKLEKGTIATPYCPSSGEALYTTMGLNSTIEYDCSGFCNNGSRGGSGTISYTSDTPKYVVSTQLIGTTVDTTSNTKTGAAYITGPCSLSNITALTVSWWAKIKQYGRGGLLDLTAVTSNFEEGTDYNTCPLSNWDSTFRLWDGTNAFNFFSHIVKDSKWHHYVVTFTSGSGKFYRDGVNIVNSGTMGNTLTNFNGVRTGLGKAGGVYRQINEDVSDLRIYATALSADDVKSLYQNSAYIDSSGNVYGAVHSEV